MKKLKTHSMKNEKIASNHSENHEHKEDATSVWKYVFFILAGILLIAMIVMSRSAGISGDEHFHVDHSQKVISFYTSFGSDTTAVSPEGSYNLPYYGQVFDTFVHVLANLFGIDDIYAFRHLCNSIVGWIIMLFVGLLAFRLGGWRAASIAILLAFLSPRLLGHSFNNSKDIPFAAAAMMSLYYMVRFLQTFPVISKKIAIMLAVSFGLAIGTRIGGLLFIAYFGLFCLVFYIVTYKKAGLFSTQGKMALWKLIKWGLGIVVGGYILAIIVWPYALVGPIKNVIESFKLMSQFDVSLRQIFEGKMYWSDALPWYYTPKYILITIPIAVILGMIVYPFVGGLKKENRFWTFVVYFAFIFPIFWLIYTKANVYGGWRHSLFVYPPMIVAAGLGFNGLISLVRNKYVKILFLALPLVMLIKPFIHIIKNHPYEYVYFNELVGGVNGAYKNYEMDYYFHGLREATEWTVDDIKKNKTGNEKTKLAGWILDGITYYTRKDTADISLIFARFYERGNSDWDYAIFPNAGVYPERRTNGSYPPQETIHTIDVDGKPITVILKRTDKSDFYGYQQMQAGNIDSAKILFKKALTVNPRNEAVLTNMANIYLQQGQLDSAEYYLKQFLSFDPNHENEKYMMALVAYYKQDFNRALAICKEMTDYNKKFSNAYSLAANIYLQTNNPYFAEKELMKLMDVGGFDQNAFNQLFSIYKSQGLDERSAQKKIFKELAKSYKKQGNKEMAAQFEEQAGRI